MRTAIQRIHVGGDIYAAGNIGDDAILFGCLEILRGAFPFARVVCETLAEERPKWLSSHIGSVTASDDAKVLRSLQAADLFIAGGGTLIGDELSLRFPLRHLLVRVATAVRYRKPAILLGIGANRPRTREGWRLAKQILGLCDLIVVREEQSKEVCIACGGIPEKIVVAADPAFLCCPERTRDSARVIASLGGAGKTIGINVVNEAWTDEMGYKRAIAAACDDLYQTGGYTPVFFSSEVREGKMYDHAANLSTAALLKCPHQVLKPDYFSPFELLDILLSFRGVIAMRMHSLILAAVAGVPFTAIARVDKVDNFMRLFGREPCGTVEACRSADIVRDFSDQLSHWACLRSDMATRVLGLRDKARSSATALCDWVKQLRERPRCRWRDFRYVLLPSYGPRDMLLRVLYRQIRVGTLLRGRLWRERRVKSERNDQ